MFAYRFFLLPSFFHHIFHYYTTGHFGPMHGKVERCKPLLLHLYTLTLLFGSVIVQQYNPSLLFS